MPTYFPVAQMHHGLTHAASDETRARFSTVQDLHRSDLKPQRLGRPPAGLRLKQHEHLWIERKHSPHIPVLNDLALRESTVMGADTGASFTRSGRATYLAEMRSGDLDISRKQFSICYDRYTVHCRSGKARRRKAAPCRKPSKFVSLLAGLWWIKFGAM